MEPATTEVRGAQGPAAPGSDRVYPGADEPARTAGAAWLEGEPIWKQLLRNCNGDLEFAQELAASFLETAPGLVARIDAALAAGDARLLASQAHGLKGISLTIGAEALAMASRMIEEAGRGADLAAARSALPALHAAAGAACAALEGHVHGDGAAVESTDPDPGRSPFGPDLRAEAPQGAYRPARIDRAASTPAAAAGPRPGVAAKEFVALSRFAVANGMTAQVKEAFRNRPHLVDAAEGFLRMEVLSPTDDPDEIWLLTYWRDAESFDAWHGSRAHREAHGGIPRGLKLVPGRTLRRGFGVVCR